ncbi:MAG: hypothetical protein H6581_14055 [Bacteroidia bacterium]|nr:hypothetical protein [Bacteroidia bacterium]
MALNHILYRPQVLERSISPVDQRMIEELLELISRMLSDGLHGGRARQKLEEGLKEAMQSLIQEMQTRLANATQNFMALINPMILAFQGLANAFNQIQNPSDGVHAMAQLLLLLADLLEGLSAQAIEEKFAALINIVTVDLGLTRERMIQFVNNAIDIVIQKMKEDFIQGDHSEQGHNEYLIGCYLEKLKRLVNDQMNQIELNLDLSQISAMLVNFLSNQDWDRIRAEAAKILKDAGNTAESIGILMDIFSGKFNVTVEVNVETEGGGGLDPVSWYATWFDRRVGHTEAVGVADRNKLEDEDFFSRMSFKKEWLSPTVMENLAHWSDVAVDAAEFGMHLRSVQKRDWVSNVANLSLNAIKGIITALIGYNDDEDWVKAYRVFGNWYFEQAVTLGVNFLTSMQGAHFKTGDGQWIFYFTLLGKDYVENLLYNNWASRIRQGLLSFFTLLNADPLGKPTSENHHKVEGFSMFVAEVFSWILAAVPGRKNFGFPATGGAGKFVGLWIMGWLGSYVGAVAGWFISWGISHSQQPEGTSMDVTKPSDESMGWLSLEALLAGLFKHPIYNYLIWNGSTENGHYGKNRDGSDFKEFKGYPPKEGSPYKMPYPSGDVRQCAQGNNGVWSHNQATNQIYAYDWDHDHWMEVLAIRPGYVEKYMDIYPDHTTEGGNGIEVWHNHHTEGGGKDPVYDRDWTDDPVLTTADYHHAAHYGVRYAFARRGIPSDRINGLPVVQGQHIMHSGDTGISFYNHLHLMVKSNNAYSLPYVFADVDEENGVCRDLTWYESGNERLPDLKRPGETVNISVVHPSFQESTVMYEEVNDITSVSAKAIELDLWIYERNYQIYGKEDDVFKGLYIEHTRPGFPPSYHKIKSWKFDKTKGAVYPGTTDPRGLVKAVVFTNWVVNPVNGDSVKIIAMAEHAGDNTLVLDRFASPREDEYKGAFILVTWFDLNGEKFNEYQEITAYNPETRKITISNNWGKKPQNGSYYVIGGRQRAQAPDYFKDFSFISEKDPGPYTLPQAKSMNIAHCSPGIMGQPLVGANAGTNTLVLDGETPHDPSKPEMFIAIYYRDPRKNPDTSLLQYKEIASISADGKTITITGTWDFYISPNRYYLIGGRNYANSTKGQRIANAFLIADNTPGTWSPKENFTEDNRPVYRLCPYPTWNVK